MTLNNYKVTAIVAMDRKRVIGNKGALVWHLPEDMKRFSNLTRGHTVVMGRKTFDSLPEKFKPLPGRKNIVISKTINEYTKYPDVLLYSTIESLVSDLKNKKLKLDSDIIWIIGGEQIYRSTQSLWDEVYLTLVPGEHQGDVYFPDFEDAFTLVKRENGEECEFLDYKRI